jgi:hypothetical protein
MKKYLILGLLVTASILILARSSKVGGQANPNPPREQTISHVYDVSDLLFEANGYPLSGDFVPLPLINQAARNANQQNGNFGAQVPQVVQQGFIRIDALKKYITDNVDTTTWKDNGGDVGSLSWSPISTDFTVVQTPENQKAIQKLLDDL